MALVRLYLLVIIRNVNELNAPIKKLRVADGSKIKDLHYILPERNSNSHDGEKQPKSPMADELIKKM